jgi:hypothetical protein
MSTRVKSPSEVKGQLQRIQAIAQLIINGLAGKPFRWGDGERSAWQPLAEMRLGITLVTASGAKKRGYRIKAGAKPVGEAYYAAPLQRYADLYVLECQCVPLAEKAQVEEAPTEPMLITEVAES